MIEQVTAGIDWLTLTLPLGSENEQHWISEGLIALMLINKEGYDFKPRGLLGYKGHSCGNCFVGSREDGHMMQFTGRFADRVFDHIYRPDTHVSRIDVQVTVKHDVMPSNVAGKGYRDAIHQDKTSKPHNRRKLFIITGSDGGQTLYVGSATSDQRGRLYNKEVQSESPEYARTWRYETVLRNDRATILCHRLLAETADRADFLSSYVAIWWETRGIEVPWLFDVSISPLPPQKTLPSDIERQVQWLCRQVRPTVQRLLAAGYRDTLLVWLGLDVEPHAAETDG